MTKTTSELLDELKALTDEQREHLKQINFVTGKTNGVLRKELEKAREAAAAFERFVKTTYPIGRKVFVRLRNGERFRYAAGVIFAYSITAHEQVAVEVSKEVAVHLPMWQAVTNHPRAFLFEWESIELADEIGAKL